ncbi:MAG TPA: LemA family protein [Saprospiraceae bacterium]|nr:LemA family protein [Saprospiraceae bacterium]HMP26066.1 LemA family protein [Saprospiraceae bacterium]
MSYFLIFIAVVVLLAVWLIGMYNGFIKLRNKVDEAWGGIQIQLKRRYDLIPNLVETVKGYATHEKETFERLVQARSAALQVPASDIQGQAQAQGAIANALKSVFAIAENYPELRASENFQQLQNALMEVEDNLQMARRYYQATVRDFNNKVETFPSMIIASVFNFAKQPFFELDSPEEARNVQVKF